MSQALRDFRFEVINAHYTDRNTATELRSKHSRTGKLPSYCTASQKQEASTHNLLAFGWDELGNIIAMTTKGTRQFI